MTDPESGDRGVFGSVPQEGQVAYIGIEYSSRR